MTKKILPTPEAKEPYKMLYIELGATEAATRANVPIGTMTKWASRYGWSTQRAVPLKLGRPAATLSHYAAKQPASGVADSDSAADAGVTPSEALEKVHQEAATRTRTALARVTAAAAEQAAMQPPPPVLSTSHLRELAAAASRVFGWDGSTKTQGDTFNTLVITHEQLAQIRALRAEATEQESDETSRRLATPEGQDQLRRGPSANL